MKKVAAGMRKLGLAGGDSVAFPSSNDVSILGDGIVAAGDIPCLLMESVKILPSDSNLSSQTDAGSN